MGRSPPPPPPLRFLNVGVLLALLVAVKGQGIVFPGSPIGESKDSCILPSGAKGTCKNINDCQVAAQNSDSQPLKICGYHVNVAIVCCPQASERLTDLSSPDINFECGLTYNRKIDSDYLYDDDYQYDNYDYYNDNTSPQQIHPLIHIPRPVLPSPSQSVPSNTGFGRRRRDLAPPYPGLGIDGPYCLDDDGSCSNCGIFGLPVGPNKYPWMALLGEDKPGQNRNWFCGGVLINRRWVLTAAHCTNTNNATVVRLGEHDFTKGDDGDIQDFNVAEVLFHDGYKYPQAYHDISLIRLAKPVKIKKEMSPVCLPWGDDADLPLEGNNVTVSGWGTTRYVGDILSPFLNEIDVTVLPTDVCATGYSKVSDFIYNYPDNLGEETLCIGATPNQTIVKDSCTGDSGGPAVLKRGEHFTVVGIVSQGFGCGKREQPGLYAAVQYHEHLAWIKRLAFSTCDSLCANGNCNPSIGCVCLNGWSGQFCDTAICNQPCLRGQCVSPDVCECESRWRGSQCQTPQCSNGKSLSSDSLSCICDSGWEDEHCDTPICESSCGKGRCNFLHVCDCDCPWYGEHCEYLFCFNGNSFDGLTCKCDVGWNGTLCDIPICNKPCGSGRCVAPNQCEHPICEQKCVRGQCVSPDESYCQCDLSKRKCQQSRAYCAEGKCECENGWLGRLCQHRTSTSSRLTWHRVGSDNFLIFKQGMSWDLARSHCRDNNLDLLKPTNAPAVATYLYENFSGFDYWIGGRSNGTHYLWVTGEVVPTISDLWSSYNRGDVSTDARMSLVTYTWSTESGEVLAVYPSSYGFSFLCG